MRTGIELLREHEEVLDDICGCDRTACRACRLRNETRAYLEVVDRKSNEQPEVRQ